MTTKIRLLKQTSFRKVSYKQTVRGILEEILGFISISNLFMFGFSK